jgi:hypothetical protein
LSSQGNSTRQHYDTIEIIALGAENCVCMFASASQTIDGGWHLVYDAAPLDYAGLKTECLRNHLGGAIDDSIGVAGHVHGTLEQLLHVYLEEVANVI